MLTRGAQGISVMQAGRAEHRPAPPAAVSNALGAGDALIAGTLAGLRQGMELTEATRLGQACAAMALESPASVPDTLSLPAAMAHARRQQA